MSLVVQFISVVYIDFILHFFNYIFMVIVQYCKYGTPFLQLKIGWVFFKFWRIGYETINLKGLLASFREHLWDRKFTQNGR